MRIYHAYAKFGLEYLRARDNYSKTREFMTNTMSLHSNTSGLMSTRILANSSCSREICTCILANSSCTRGLHSNTSEFIKNTRSLRIHFALDESTEFPLTASICAKLKVAPYSFLTARELVSKSRDGAGFKKSTRKSRATRVTRTGRILASIVAHVQCVSHP